MSENLEGTGVLRGSMKRPCMPAGSFSQPAAVCASSVFPAGEELPQSLWLHPESSPLYVIFRYHKRRATQSG